MVVALRRRAYTGLAGGFVGGAASAAGVSAGLVGAIGVTSSFSEPRNSRMALPRAAPVSGSLPGPRMSRAITRTMMRWTGVMPAMGGSS